MRATTPDAVAVGLGVLGAAWVAGAVGLDVGAEEAGLGFAGSAAFGVLGAALGVFDITGAGVAARWWLWW